MSDDIPLEIQAEIFKRLPVSSLLRFRSVSKRWKSLIDSREFVAGYNVYPTQPQRLLIWYEYPVDSEEKRVSFLDDVTFTQQDFGITVPVLVKRLKESRVVGSSQGLLCLYGYHHVPGYSRYRSAVREMIVLWNPSIRKSVGIPVPGVVLPGLQIVLGFGVCPITSDPTIVKIKQVEIWFEKRSRDNVPSVVDVFTLSSGRWKSFSSNLPNNSIKIRWSQVVIDRFIYWFASDKMVAANGGVSRKNLIMSFDMTNQEFGVVDLPESLSYQSDLTMFISKVRESLAVLEYGANIRKRDCNVWVMDHDVPNLFTKLFTINAPYSSINTLAFTKSGEAIVEAKDYYKETAALVVYQPCSGHVNDIGLNANYGSFFVGSYMETLLLLD
ncbi:hypothetical protein L1887_06398 [Cichorium endivia]|nr:hypothetical protein L1887_06398 [Cichorium endivia]